MEDNSRERAHICAKEEMQFWSKQEENVQRAGAVRVKIVQDPSIWHRTLRQLVLKISNFRQLYSFIPFAKNYILAIIKIGSFDPCHDANKNHFYSHWWQIQKKKKYRFQRQMNQIRLDWKMFLFGILLIKKLPKGLFPLCLRLLFGGLIWTTSNLFNQTGGANIKYFIKYFLSIQKRANKFYQIFS